MKKWPQQDMNKFEQPWKLLKKQWLSCNNLRDNATLCKVRSIWKNCNGCIGKHFPYSLHRHCSVATICEGLCKISFDETASTSAISNIEFYENLNVVAELLSILI